MIFWNVPEGQDSVVLSSSFSATYEEALKCFLMVMVIIQNFPWNCICYLKNLCKSMDQVQHYAHSMNILFLWKVACRIPSREKHWKEGWASDKPIRGGVCHNSNLAGRCRTLFLEQVQCIGHCTKLFILSHSFHPLGKGCVFPILKIRWLRFYSINRLNTPKLETTELGFRQRLVRLHAEVS